VIILTCAEQNETNIDQLKNLGIFSYLKKSADFTEIIHTIRQYFQSLAV